MKDYHLDNNSREFIETYSFSDDIEKTKIIISLGSGEKYVIPNTPGNLKKIESIIKKQYEDFKLKRKIIIKKRKKALFLKKVFIFLSALIIGVAIPGSIIGILLLKMILPITATISYITGVVFITALGGLSLYNYEKYLNYKQDFETYTSILDDINKHDIFFDIQTTLEMYLRKDNPNIMLGLSNDSMSKLKKTSTSTGKIFLNKVHDLTLEELRTLKENILRIENFNFEGDATPKQELKQEKEVVVEEAKCLTMTIKEKN